MKSRKKGKKKNCRRKISNTILIDLDTIIITPLRIQTLISMTYMWIIKIQLYLLDFRINGFSSSHKIEKKVV